MIYSFYWSKNLQWNIVDARGSDGLLHYGHVIDCAEEGLIIDFGGGKSPQQVPFGQIYRCKLEEFKHEGPLTNKENLSVDALLRVRSDEPAKWYPGVVLTGNFDLFGSFALVRITTPEGTSAEVVSGDRVRGRRYAERLGQVVLEKGLFAKEEIQLPSGVASGSPSPSPYRTPLADRHLVENFSKNCPEQWMVATHIDGGVLHVLKITGRFRRRFDRGFRSSCPKLQGDALFHMLGVTPQTQRKRPNEEEDAPTKRVPSSSSATHTASQSAASSTTAAPSVVTRLISHVNGSAASKPSSTPSTPSLQPLSLKNVPREVLAEILECLDGSPQTALRRVCTTWNDVLTALPVRRMFRVSEGCPVSGAMGPRTCLLKRWTAQTKIIVYRAINSTGSIFDADVDGRFADKQYYGSLLCSGRFFQWIFQENQLPRLDKLLLGNVGWEWRGYREKHTFSHFINHIRTELNYFASVCQGLILKKFTVALSGEKAPVVVRFTDARIAGRIAVDTLWDLMDKSLPPLSQEDSDSWAEWMSDNSNTGLAGQIVEILNERQSADPRDCNPFPGKKWARHDLAKLDLDKLNPITSHSLVKTCCYEKLILLLRL